MWHISSLVDHQGGDVEGVDVQELRLLVRQVVEDLPADLLHIRLACVIRNLIIRMLGVHCSGNFGYTKFR